METTIAIFSIIITIIIGYIGVRYSLKYRSNKEILFLKNNSISLFKTLVKNFDDIEINFQGNKINENLIFFKGTFLNSGNQDIDMPTIYKPLEIELPSESNWVRYNIIDASQDLKIGLAVEGNKLIFTWDIFKQGEYFTFDSLIEYKSKSDDYDIGKKLLNEFKINQRIKNLNIIKNENMIPRPLTISSLLIASLLVIGISVFFLYLALLELSPSYEILTEAYLENEQQYVFMKAINNNEVTLRNIKGDHIVTLNKNILPKVTGSTVVINKTSVKYSPIIALVFMSFLVIFLWVIMIISEIKNRNLYSKTKIIIDKYEELDKKYNRDEWLRRY